MSIKGLARSFRDPHSLRVRALRAGSWTLIGFGVAMVMRLVGNLILSRILAPDVFGILAIATVVQMVVAVMSDVGLRQSVIQSRNGENQQFLNTAWTLQIIRGFVIWLGCVCVALALLVANSKGWLPQDSVYADPALPVIVVATSFSSVILGFQSMKVFSLSRGLDVRQIVLIELIQMTFGLAIALLLGWLTQSIWAFVASQLSGSVITAFLTRIWLRGPRDRFAWDKSALSELLHVGKWVFLSSAIGVIATNGDRLLLGGWMSPALLGCYSIAAALAAVPDSVGARLFSNVSLPALSEMARNKPDRFPYLFNRMRWTSDAAYVGIGGFLFATAPSIIANLYDARYLSAGPMLQWLSCSLLFSRYGLAQNAYMALGKQNYIVAINIVKTASLFLVVPILYNLYGDQGAILGISFSLAPTLLLVLWFNSKHRLNNLSLEIFVLLFWPLGWMIGRLSLGGLSYFELLK